MKLELYTYGYLGGDKARLTSVLATPGAMLLDIRFLPHSRVPGYSGAEFAARWGEQYKHVRALGNKNFRGGPIELVSPEAGVKYVLELLKADRDVVLMCACKNYEVCHRKVAAELVAARGSAILASIGVAPVIQIIDLHKPVSPDPQRKLW